MIVCGLLDYNNQFKFSSYHLNLARPNSVSCLRRTQPSANDRSFCKDQKCFLLVERHKSKCQCSTLFGLEDHLHWWQRNFNFQILYLNHTMLTFHELKGNSLLSPPGFAHGFTYGFFFWVFVNYFEHVKVLKCSKCSMSLLPVHYRLICLKYLMQKMKKGSLLELQTMTQDKCDTLFQFVTYYGYPKLKV